MADHTIRAARVRRPWRTGAPIEDIFWARVNRRGYDECWPWLAGCNGAGYGSFLAKAGEFGLEKDRVLGAHRVAFYLTHGQWPEPFALHGCDNPPCCNAVNPLHLHEGDGSLNMLEKFARDRQDAHQRSGEGHARAKFTNQQVREIRARYAAGGVFLSDLAAEYGVTRNAISHIVNRKRYAEVV